MTPNKPSAKQAVLAVYPRAGAFPITAGGFLVVPDRKTEYEQDILGAGATRAAAWNDAAKRIGEKS